MKIPEMSLKGAALRLVKGKWREWILLGLGALMVAVFYGLSKCRDGTRRDVGPAEGGSQLKRERIFESSSAAVAREKDTHLARSARELGGGVKMVKDDVQALKAEVEMLRALVAERLHVVPPAAGEAPSTGSAPAPPSPEIQAAKSPPALGNQTEQEKAKSQGEKSGGGHTDTAEARELWQKMRQRVRSLPAIGVPARGSAIVSFPVKAEEGEKIGVTLPTGGFVKARMLTGVAAPEGKPYPSLLALDYAYVLPNRHRLDLSGCFVVAKAQGDLSTERVQMQATKMSCVGRDGRMFERDISAFVADDKDNNFAVSGEVQSKQDRVAIMAFLASVVQGVSQAVQQAQTTTQVTPMGAPQQLLTGSEQRYIAAGGASDAAGQVAAWYLKEAQNLLPTINVNSGREVWLVMQESVSLPASYFKKPAGGEEHAYSYVTRLLE